MKSRSLRYRRSLEDVTRDLVEFIRTVKEDDYEGVEFTHRCVERLLFTYCFEAQYNEGDILRVMLVFFVSLNGHTRMYRFWDRTLYSPEKQCEKLRYFLPHFKHLNLPLPCSCFCTKGRIKFVDAPLLFHETPLEVASNLLLPGSVALLLRYGASTKLHRHTSGANNIADEDAFETMLKDHHVYLLNDEEDVEALHKCVELYMRAMLNVDMKRLEAALESSQFALHYPNWHKLIPATRFKEPPELKHCCKHVIRNELSRENRLPEGLQELGLPTHLVHYMDLLTN